MPTEEADFFLESYNFALPEAQIAQFPPEERGNSRLLVMPRQGALELEHHQFSDLPDCLPEGALLVAVEAGLPGFETRTEQDVLDEIAAGGEVRSGAVLRGDDDRCSGSA